MNTIAVVLLVMFEIGLPVMCMVWLWREGGLTRRARALERQAARQVSREVRRECADLDAEYARLVRRGGRV